MLFQRRQTNEIQYESYLLRFYGQCIKYHKVEAVLAKEVSVYNQEMSQSHTLDYRPAGVISRN